MEHDILGAIDSAVERNSTFSELLSGDDKKYLMENGIVRSAREGEVLCQQFQRDDRVYVLVLGEVEVIEEVEGKEVVLARLSKGELFGEISALFGIPRVSSVRVSKPAVLLEIRGSILDHLISASPHLRETVIQRCQERITAASLRAVAPFRVLPPEAIELLIQNSSLVSYAEGSEIVKQGEAGDAFFIIVYGVARVSSCSMINQEETPVSIALLRPGEYFGEWSLLTGSPRTATVTAATQVEMLRVNCAGFLEFMQQYPEIHDRIDRVAHNRHEVVAYTSTHPESARKRHDVLSSIEKTVRDDESHFKPWQ